MGKRGPQKTPTAILKLRGSGLLDNRTEAERIPVSCQCPSDLCGYAKSFWQNHIVYLDSMGIISAQDLCQFRLLCEAHGDYDTIRNNTDYHTKIKLRNEIFRLASHFGMTPSTRSDVPHETKNSNPFIELSKGTG